MSGTEQVLILVGLPAVAVAIIWALASIGGPQARKRYRPSRPYDYTPVWYVANHRGHESATRAEATDPEPSAPVGGSTGGASDRW
jgi:hypothetical protein